MFEILNFKNFFIRNLNLKYQIEIQFLYRYCSITDYCDTDYIKDYSNGTITLVYNLFDMYEIYLCVYKIKIFIKQ